MQNLEIIRMQLIGFGKFRDRTIELSPGLNLLEGPNEAGKSTIQAFLTGMFYGFFQPGNQTPQLYAASGQIPAMGRWKLSWRADLSQRRTNLAHRAHL